MRRTNCKVFAIRSERLISHPVSISVGLGAFSATGHPTVWRIATRLDNRRIGGDTAAVVGFFTGAGRAAVGSAAQPDPPHVRVQSTRRNATRSCFSGSVSLTPSTRLKNSTVSSSVNSWSGASRREVVRAPHGGSGREDAEAFRALADLQHPTRDHEPPGSDAHAAATERAEGRAAGRELTRTDRLFRTTSASLDLRAPFHEALE
jgi:hypothetical protein